MIKIQSTGIALRPLRDTATVPTFRCWFLATVTGHESNYKQESAMMDG